MIISVSDAHLGEDGYQEQDSQFSRFLDFVKDDALQEGGHLVLLGDIFDFWRKDSTEILEKYRDPIRKLFEFPDDIEIHYVVGNHDFYMSEIKEYFGESPFKFFGSTTNIREGHTFRFIHGYQLEVMANPYSKDMKLYENLARRLSYHSGITGHAASVIWNSISSLMQKEGKYSRSMLKAPESRLHGDHRAEDKITALAESPTRQLLLGGLFDWLIYGHTHNPFIDPASRTINTGSWGRNRSLGKMCYLKISDGLPRLMEWKKM